MKLIERSLFTARAARLLFLVIVIFALNFLIAGTGCAQTILPIALEQSLGQKLAEPEREASVAAPAVQEDPSPDDASNAPQPPRFLPNLPAVARVVPLNAAFGSNANQWPSLQNDRRQASGAFNWNDALRQSSYFLGIQHAFRLAQEPSTRAELGGPFFKDYFKALRGLRGWGDGDPLLVNYIGHPMMGSVSGFIHVQNNPRGIHEEISLKKSYWASRLKALGWSFMYSTQFELGLISEASVGNIGIKPNGKSNHAMAYVDLVVTPVVGTAWLVGEDALDKYFIRRFENDMPNRFTFVVFRSLLNPTRSFANVMRGKRPWYRDNRN